jgi:hypothetical protein
MPAFPSRRQGVKRRQNRGKLLASSLDAASRVCENLCMTTKPRLTAGQMAEIRKISDEIRHKLEDIVQDFSTDIVADNHDWDLTESGDIPEDIIDLQINYEGIIVDMILQDLRREF